MGYQKINKVDFDFSAFDKKSKNLSLVRKIVRLFTRGALIEMETLREFLKQACGDMTFRESYEQNGWIINIVVCGDHHEEYKVLNYMSAPHVLIWSASLASCSFPFVFKPSKILCKDSYGKIREWLPISKIPVNQAKSLWMEPWAKIYPKERWLSCLMLTTSSYLKQTLSSYTSSIRDAGI
jgi:hypothetical protein